MADNQLLEEAERMIQDGHWIGAIRPYRQATGCTLVEATNYCRARYGELHYQGPQEKK